MNLSRRDLLSWSAGSAALLATGCPKPAPPAAAPAVDEKPLRLLLVAPPEKYAERLQRNWVAQTDAPFEMRSCSAAEAVVAQRFKADVIIYPSRLLGAFAASERLAALSRGFTEGESLHAGDLLRHARTTEVAWGAATMGVCLGAPAYVLMYRKDIFDELSLQAPASWEDYQACVSRLKESAKPVHVVEPIDVAADCVLLARAAAYVRNRKDYGGLFDLKTMKPLIAEAPFVRALEELVDANRDAPNATLAKTNVEAFQSLLEGKAGIIWAWPTASSDEANASAGANVAVAPLPGSRDYYDFRAGKWLMRGDEEDVCVPLLGGGVLGSVTTEARRPKAAENFLAWLSAGENAVEVATSRDDAGPFRRSHLDQPRPWVPSWFTSEATEQYAEAVRKLQEQSVVLLGPRVPGEAEYTAVLRQAVQETLQGKTAAGSLALAAREFDAITDRHGRDAQRLNYQRSLGLDV